MEQFKNLILQSLLVRLNRNVNLPLTQDLATGIFNSFKDDLDNIFKTMKQQTPDDKPSKE